MDFLQKIGGRKFWMANICLGVATYIELHNPTGLGATMATFLGSVLAAFSVANYASSAKHMDSRQGSTGGKAADISSQLESIQSQIAQANDPEKINALVNLLTDLHNKIQDVENVSRQVGSGVLNLGNQVQAISKRLT
jgi:hypothetical protein